ncbi:hypothetical protein TNCV_3381711 [Trichonephila clavipes]|nr:hypothetical protein TNCV_3381711 [Trichonephila clavipes]
MQTTTRRDRVIKHPDGLLRYFLANLLQSTFPGRCFQTLTVARNELESCGEACVQLFKGLLNLNATEISDCESLAECTVPMRFFRWTPNLNPLHVGFKCLCMRNFITIG